MNPLTLVKRIQSINAKEQSLGISDEASWHAKYKDSAYVFVGGIPYDLTEGDLLAVFAQYGEIMDVNLVREKATGKSKGFAFVAYEDQRSTVLAVDNLNGAQIAGRTIRVDHVSNYKKKQEEDEETERQKREERGVCRQFQKGECKYGDSCRFSHDEQRAANTGWGPEEERKSRSTHGNENDKRSRDAPPSRVPEHRQIDAYDGRSSRGKYTTESGRRQNDASSGDQDNGDKVRRSNYREDQDKRIVDKRSSRYELESRDLNDYDGRDEKRPKRHDKEREKDSGRDGAGKREREKRSSHHRDRDEEDRCRTRRDDDYQSSRR